MKNAETKTRTTRGAKSATPAVETKAPKAAKTTKATKAAKVAKNEVTAEAKASATKALNKTFTKAQKGLLDNIAKAVAAAPHGEKLTTVHILSIKHSEELEKVSARAFCQATGLPKAYGIEFTRVSQLSDRLKECGLDLAQL